MDPSATIISALKDRELSINRDQIRSALADRTEGTEIAKWLTEHLSTDTLLSQEELILYSKLEDSGALQTLLANSNLKATRPLVDDDLRRAIETLDASTAAIQRQTNTLASQYESLDRSITSDDELGLRQNRDIARLRQKHTSERQNITAASCDLAHALESELRGVSEQASADAKRILSSLTARFKEDDRLIANLERLASGIETSQQDENSAKIASERCTALAQCVADEIKCRLDRLYLESIRAGLMKMRTEPAPTEDEPLAALEEELESLYPEIDVLAEMSTRQQFAVPIIGELSSHYEELQSASHETLDYVLDVVSEMASSTNGLVKCLQDRESYCGTLEAIAAAHRSEIGDIFLGPSNPRRETLRRSSVQPVSISSSAQKDNSRPHDPQLMAKVLRRVGLSLDSMLHADEASECAVTLKEKRHQLTESLHDHGNAADSPLIAELLPTDRAIRLLSTSLHADSEFETSLANLDNQRKLSNLEDDLKGVQKGLEGLDMSVVHRRERGREKFVERWGSKALDE
ncbi:hypothetical protein CBS63078_7344 [Aspergillus niger]|nr:hypothetical protein ANI_1_356044 [Aspergillus niger CBS 513.88]EHA25105.1 hypothetical protein ASPNIDRAFT_42545 [Aspergillus niger ATCC 1015]KAI2824377.1 hypothetical protein CBS115989_788 [Aspergillus niger]KAI2825530.1 hypothetical protein CBS133816_8391 [Aspergillus niger]KAI2838458.1 hypothetical protein CBS11232_9623 [Aspergillus niger]KAI2842668.1 hypothetical protein CBS11350_5636 [Aspergillus niger]|eukprot:XP_001390592.2 hypothetical protein ANI_1_356044 [Aspergillus niger CBS 513.88]